MEEVWPLVPLAADHSVGIAVVSYAGKVFFGLSGDERTAADLEVLGAGIESAITELVELAATGHALPALADARGCRHVDAVAHVPVAPISPERIMSVLEPAQPRSSSRRSSAAARCSDRV